MKKSRGISTLIIIVLLITGLAYTAVMGIGTEKAGSASQIKQGLDLAGGVSITYQAVGEENPSAEDMADTIYKLQKRVESYSTESQVYQEGDNRINIEIPGVTDANSILEELGKPGSLYFIAQTDSEGNENYSIDYSTYSYVLNKTLEELEADGSIVLTGTEVKAAQAGQITNDMGNKEYAVDLEFTSEGSTKFAEATKKAYENGETIAIYYDETFVSVPTVNSVIADGRANITNMSSFEEAEKLASTIRIGGLKLELEELRSNVVGAQLGEAAISTSLKAGAIGFALVAFFMIAVYLIPGLSSVLALCIYVSLMVILLEAFDITLTLPGIAG
ncbi:MAG: protein translocase subunit SecDF, partial [Lachnospiraceae bacterium]|nr:protein translocase subunit SecDF [Lachnospiraceae bacterium]